jgi:ornithine carbamoyltransferase
MQRRTELLSKNDRSGLVKLEKACLVNNARYKDWECNEQKMKLTTKGCGLYMHCLPADISGVSCEQGEVSKGVFEKYRLATYAEAGFKPFVIAAIIFLTRIQKPADALQAIIKRNTSRTV